MEPATPAAMVVRITLVTHSSFSRLDQHVSSSSRKSNPQDPEKQNKMVTVNFEA